MSETDGLARIRITGRGGQGVMLAGAVLAEAAMLDGKHVTETQEYGPEARLGSTKAEVILSVHPIAFPEVVEPDILVIWSREGLVRYGRRLAPDGIVLVEESALLGMDPDPGMHVYPWRERARRLGQELVMNMLGLGTLSAVTGLVSLRSLENAVQHRVRAELLDLNIQALREGFRLAAEESPLPSRS
jgi:2-oxoglutarate ferredoxin oxidoreductase subunit gamma